MVNKSSVLCALLSLLNATLAAAPIGAFESTVRRTTIGSGELVEWDTDLSSLYPAYNLSVPIDHFHNDSRYEPHSDDTFNLRYWFDNTYYKKGGPVIILQSGETSGRGRLPFLQKGILHDLAKATNGIGVVLEHRYYGASVPTPDFSTENLRFLSTEQALADEAYFAQNVVFPGMEDKNLTAPNVAYIGYGGSYAGGMNAFLRKVYPDIFWGAIASSGVVEAIWDYWSYFEPVRVYANAKCIEDVQKITNVVDNIFIGLNNTETTAELKAAFGLPNITHDDDFAYVIAAGINNWQGKNWDPAINVPYFDQFCAAITAESLIYHQAGSLKGTVEDLLRKGGYGSEISTLTLPMMNWIGWIKQNVVDFCHQSQDLCFSFHNEYFYVRDDIDQNWRLWPYQYCTEWGYLITGAGVPEDQLPLLSRTLTLEWHTIICKYAFNITSPADVEAVNKYGGFGISYPRLAFIDGELDPWRPATPHAAPFNATAENRTNTESEPFILIEGALHHWDENGLFPNETVDSPPNYLPPLPVRDAQSQEIEFVQEWLQEWKEHCLSNGRPWW